MEYQEADQHNKPSYDIPIVLVKLKKLGGLFLIPDSLSCFLALFSHQ